MKRKLREERQVHKVKESSKKTSMQETRSIEVQGKELLGGKGEKGPILSVREKKGTDSWRV